MAAVAILQHRAISRARFMVWTIGLMSGAIALAYAGIILRYLYPKNAEDTPPLPLKVAADGVTDPVTGLHHTFANGVAGPLYYPMSGDRSVVVGVFVEKKDAAGPLMAGNLLVAEQTCTHLGCPVAWVPGDDKYECPCHGSQFHRDLSVAHGPAQRPLVHHEFTLAGDTLTILKRAPEA
jgi:Rieske Fe-S protein